jgi:hypothetical protein
MLTDGGTWIGHQPGSSGVNVSGAAGGQNAEIRVTGRMSLGRALHDNPGAGGGDGSLIIGAGGSVTVNGATYLGSTGVDPGTGTITLDGGTLATRGLEASAGSGVIHKSGTLILTSGASPANLLRLAGITATLPLSVH